LRGHLMLHRWIVENMTRSRSLQELSQMHSKHFLWYFAPYFVVDQHRAESAYFVQDCMLRSVVGAYSSRQQCQEAASEEYKADHVDHLLVLVEALRTS
jgi:hypothetical protein